MGNISRQRAGRTNIPLICLFVVQVGMLVFMAMTGGFDVRFTNDSGSYLDFDFSTLRAILSQPRTVGYPLFLQIAGGQGGGCQYVPLVQFLIFQASVVLLFLTVARFNLSPWYAFAFCAPLVFSVLATHYSQLILSDSLGASVLILAVAALLHYLGARSLPSALVLALAVFFSYQVRPANLFLIPAIPVAGLLYFRGQAGSGAGKSALFLALICLAPYLAMCSLRSHLVGHFGHVSFAGANLISVAAPLIIDKRTPNLSPEARVLADDILDRRTVRGMQPYPVLSRADIIIREREQAGLSFHNLNDDPSRAGHILRWYAEHDLNNWHIAIPAARQQLSHIEEPQRWVQIDALLAELSAALIRSNPGAYLEWLALGYVVGLYKTAVGFKGLAWGVAGIFVLLLALALRRQVGVFRNQFTPEAMLLVYLPLLLCAFSLSLTLITQPPRFRYLFHSGLFLEGAAAVVLLAALATLATRTEL